MDAVGAAGSAARLGLAVLLFATTAAGAADEPPADTERLDPVALEGRLAEAPSDPAAAVAAAVTLAGFSYDAASLSLEARFAGPEGTGPLSVELVLDGLLDDSVRAVWWRVVFEEDRAGVWRVLGAERAWRCRRADEGFGTALCP